MTRSLSGDLRGRVIAAIEDGVSTREAARRFRIGISTAGPGIAAIASTGEMEARKQGQPSTLEARCARGFSFSGLIRGGAGCHPLPRSGSALPLSEACGLRPRRCVLSSTGAASRSKKSRRTPQSSSAPMSCAAA